MTDDATPPAEAGQGDADGGAAVDALNGAGNAPWYGDIEDADLKSWAENKGFADPQTALKSYREVEKLVGANDRIALPAENEDLADWSGWDKLGAPKEAKDYAEKVSLPDLPDGMKIDQALMDKAFEVGAAKRIPAAHMQEMVNLFAESQKAQFEAAQNIDRQDRLAVDELYNEWGPQKDAKLEMAKRAAAHFGFDDSLIQEGSDTLGSAKFIAKMSEVGAAMAEGGLISGGQSGLTPDQAREELTAMKSNMDDMKAVMDTGHPDHQRMKERFQNLSLASMG